MKSQTYMDRALRSSDPRYARILTQLGYAKPEIPATGGKGSRRAPKLPLEHGDGGTQKVTAAPTREPNADDAQAPREDAADAASEQVTETEQSSET